MNQAASNLTTSTALATLVPDQSTHFFDGKPVRVLTVHGEPWFMAADVCAALSLSNPSMTVQSLDEDERSKFNLGRQGEAIFVSDGGLYALIMRTRKAMEPGSAAHRFRKWVTGEVLPSIRKTGAYALSSAPVPAINVRDQNQLQVIALQLLQVTQEQAASLAVAEAKVEAARPAVEFCEALADSDGTWGLQAAGKALRQPPNKFVAWLKGRHDLYERNGGNVASQRLIDRGLFTVVWAEHGGKPRPVTRLTGKGIVFYAKELGVKPPAPPSQGSLPGF
ncbi:phage antirepressor KilAC domain-containing protein [Methylobacterium sp. yr596]|uniref:phage antirepressor n=1 Tax=Methylobacterium sp. yr596 TaxID=1761800 RepID=UPI0008EDBC7F|nr:phage antirepressor KilAC domain-containing protein [Methylobacterium sp. yr596]SFE90418.1 Phage antirepressor protein KilAC domain-containing protein [Methylobacterium sp. yr596]